MPPFPTSFIMAPELRKHPHKITLTDKNTNTGATNNTQSGKSAPCLMVDAETDDHRDGPWTRSAWHR